MPTTVGELTSAAALALVAHRSLPTTGVADGSAAAAAPPIAVALSPVWRREVGGGPGACCAPLVSRIAPWLMAASAAADRASGKSIPVAS